MPLAGNIQSQLCCFAFAAFIGLRYLRQKQYCDLWLGLVDTFRLFETGGLGEQLGIKPLGGMLFDRDTLHYLKSCTISNKELLEAFDALNKFTDENGQPVKINYSSLDVEEFGSVYEGILEMRPFVQSGAAPVDWQFGFVGGFDRKSTSSYYTRPDLVQNLIRTTLEPVIKERIAKCKTTEEKVRSLLSMKVCDAASGSGHIVLAMARTIAWYICMLRTGEDNPASLDYRQALREVIQNVSMPLTTIPMPWSCAKWCCGLKDIVPASRFLSSTITSVAAILW